MGLSWMEHDGRLILVTTYGTDRDVNIRLLHEQGEIERSNRNLLILSDFRATRGTVEYMDALRSYGKEFRAGPTNVRNAIIGITGLKRALFKAYVTFTGDRHTKAFDSMEQAVDWLTA